MRIECSQCGKSYQVGDHLAGKKARCRCGASIAIPALETPAASDLEPLGSNLASESDPLFAGSAPAADPLSGADPLGSDPLGSTTPFDFSDPVFAQPAVPGSPALPAAPLPRATVPANSSPPDREANALKQYVRDDQPQEPPVDPVNSAVMYGSIKAVAILIVGAAAIVYGLAWSGAIAPASLRRMPSKVLALNTLWMSFNVAIDVAAFVSMFWLRRIGWYVGTFSYAFWSIGVFPLFLASVSVEVSVLMFLIMLFYAPYGVHVLHWFFKPAIVNHFSLRMNRWAAVGIVYGVAVVVWAVWYVAIIKTLPPFKRNPRASLPIQSSESSLRAQAASTLGNVRSANVFDAAGSARRSVQATSAHFRYPSCRARVKSSCASLLFPSWS